MTTEYTAAQVAALRRAKLAVMAAELEELRDTDPATAVEYVGGMVANQDAPNNVRGRLSDIRALAALEYRLGAGAELSVAQFAQRLGGGRLDAAGGMSVTRALFLVARGREVMGRHEDAAVAP